MKTVFALALASVLLAGSAAASTPPSTCSFDPALSSDWENAFVQLHGQAGWPLAGGGPEMLTSTFGPRYKSSGGQYDFHRGVDMKVPTNTPVVAPLDGEIVAYENTTLGGKMLTVMHTMYTGWLTDWNSTSWTTFFTRYAHLNGLPSSLKKLIDKQGLNGCKTIPVTKGMVIAYTGQTGNASFPQLHYEVRMGTRFDLQDQLDGFGGGPCLKDIVPPEGAEIDPHVNPLILYPQADPLLLAQRQAVCPLAPLAAPADTSVEYISDGDDVRLNRVYVNVYDSGGACFDSDVKDFNMRWGFDASSGAVLDTQDLDHPYFEPVNFGGATLYTNFLTIPATWLNALSPGSQGTVEVVFEDIWDQRVSCSFPFAF